MEKKYGTIAIQHVGMHVHNLEETVKWYQDILGFELVNDRDDLHNPGVFPKCWLMQLGDFYLEIYEALDAEPYSFREYEYSVGLKHLDFWVEDLDGFMEELYARKDVTILVDNRYSEEFCRVPGGDRAVYILDNNGMLVELSAIKDRN